MTYDKAEALFKQLSQEILTSSLTFKRACEIHNAIKEMETRYDCRAFVDKYLVKTGAGETLSMIWPMSPEAIEELKGEDVNFETGEGIDDALERMFGPM